MGKIVLLKKKQWKDIPSKNIYQSSFCSQAIIYVTF